MINNFGDIKLSEYRPTPRGLPVENILKSYDKLEARYDKNLMFSEQLQEKVDELKVEDHNAEYLDNAKNNLYNTLNTIVESGNLEYGEKGLMKAAKDFKNSDLLKESLESYAMFQQWQADIKERGLDIEDPDRINKWYQYYRQNAKKLERDENGNVINRFNLPRPVDTPDLNAIADEFLKGFEADDILGIATNPNPDAPNLQPLIDFGDYVGVGGVTSIKSTSKMNKALSSRFISDPKVMAYFDEMYMLDKSLNTDDIGTKLNSVGIDDLKILDLLSKEGLTNEEVYNQEILNLEIKLNSLSKLYSNEKNSEKREELYKQYITTQNNLNAAAELQTDKILSGEDYNKKLEKYYYSGFISSKLKGVTDSYVEKYDSVKTKYDVKDKWRLKMDLQHSYNMRLKDYEFGLKMKNTISNMSDFGSEFTVSYDNLTGDGKRNYDKNLANIETLTTTLAKTPKGTDEYNRLKLELDKAQVGSNGYVEVVKMYYDELVKLDPSVNNKFIISYDEYLKKYKQYIHDSKDKPLSKDEYLVLAINDKANSLRKTVIGSQILEFGNLLDSRIMNSKKLALLTIRGNTVDYDNFQGEYSVKNNKRLRGSLERSIDLTSSRYESQDGNRLTITGKGWENSAEDENFVELMNLNSNGQKLAIRGQLYNTAGDELYIALTKMDGKVRINGNVVKLDNSEALKKSLIPQTVVNPQVLRDGSFGYAVNFYDKSGNILVGENNQPVVIYAKPLEAGQETLKMNLLETAEKGLGSYHMATQGAAKLAMENLLLQTYLRRSGIVFEDIINYKGTKKANVNFMAGQLKYNMEIDKSGNIIFGVYGVNGQLDKQTDPTLITNDSYEAAIIFDAIRRKSENKMQLQK
jgi:hypothetical protein